MWDLCTNALDTAKLRGASYGDVRVMHLRQRDLTTKNRQVGTLAQSDWPGDSRAGERRLGICIHGSFDAGRRRGLRGPGRFHREGLGSGEAQRRRSSPGKSLCGQLAEPVAQGPVRDPARNAARAIAGRRYRDASRERRNADGNEHAISQDRFVVCVEHRVTHSPAQSDFRLRNRRDIVSRRGNSEAILSQQFWRAAYTPRLRTR